MTHRILLICVFVFVLLNSMAISAEPYNYAERWRSWNIIAREAYIDGATDGIAEAYFVITENIAEDRILKKPELPQVRKVRERLFVRDTRNQVCEVITDLYKDPANAFISFMNMFFLSRDKIEGKDITKGMMEARKKAMEIHRLNEQMKNK